MAWAYRESILSNKYSNSELPMASSHSCPVSSGNRHLRFLVDQCTALNWPWDSFTSIIQSILYIDLLSQPCNTLLYVPIRPSIIDSQEVISYGGQLGAIGCDDGSVKWFNSYLSNRSQFIDIKGTLSDRGEVTCGVTQGSILGPLLFLIYVNDMESAVDCDLLLYADDSALLIRGKNITDIEQKLSEELTKLNVWLIDNKLSLHLGKRESILFASNRKLKQHNFLRISCNGIKVGGKEVVTYLGGQLDQDLSGKSMAQKIIHKVNASLKFLYRKKMFLNQYCRKTVCMAMIQSRIDYQNSYWVALRLYKIKWLDMF